LRAILSNDPDPLPERIAVTEDLARAIDDDLDGQEPR
jgi:hypothetical protein